VGPLDGPLCVAGMPMSSSTYTPLDCLLDLACRDGVDIRPTLLRVITDLYIQKQTHSGEEERQYVELALGLIDAVDEPTRAIVAARLASYAGAPLTVLRKLGLGHALAGNEVPQRISAGRAAPSPVDQFFFASADERRVILTGLAGTGPHSADPPPVSADTIIQLENAALGHNTQEFTRILGRALGTGAALTARIVQDASGEPIVVAAKALGMKAAVLQRILLVLNPVISHSVERVFSLALLYDEISASTAKHMVTLWRTTAVPALSRHAPLYWDDGRKGARAAANPSARPIATRVSNPGPAQIRTNER
jgi:uncharacterized protein (DUF2336 family)